MKQAANVDSRHFIALAYEIIGAENRSQTGNEVEIIAPPWAVAHSQCRPVIDAESVS